VLYRNGQIPVCWNGPRNVLRPTFSYRCGLRLPGWIAVDLAGHHNVLVFTQLPPGVKAFQK